MPHNPFSVSPSIRQILSTPSTAALETFDPWNSASTGHQRAESSHSHASGWKQLRNEKLCTQFDDRNRRRGGRESWEMADRGNRVGRRLDKDMNKKEGGGGKRNGDIRSFLGGVRKKAGGRRCDEGDNDKLCLKRKRRDEEVGAGTGAGAGAVRLPRFENGAVGITTDRDEGSCESSKLSNTVASSREDGYGHGHDVDGPYTSSQQQLVSMPTNTTTTVYLPTEDGNNTNKRIFANLTIYINGSTAPLISDHKLKDLLTRHGANISISLARRSVTHVILGRPNSVSGISRSRNGNEGAGGGLAATKLQREIRRVGGKSVKFVGVEWILESIKIGRRLPEARFANMLMVSNGQRTVLEDFGTIAT